MILGSEVEESEVKKHLVQAYEMYGDTLMRRGKYEGASDMYNTMFKNCDRYVIKMKQHSRCHRSLFRHDEVC